MTEEEKVEQEKQAQDEAAKKAAEEEAVKKAAVENKRVKIENGQVILTETDYNNLVTMKDDMLKYKDKMRETETKLEALIEEKSKAEKDQLEKEKKFEELYEREKKEKVDMQIKINEQEITSALQIKALELGIVKAEYIKLIDRAQIKRNDDTGELSGIDEVLKSFKEQHPSLFSNGASPPVDTSQGGGSSGVITDEDLLKYTAADIMKIKREDSGLYERWTKLATKGRKNSIPIR